MGLTETALSTGDGLAVAADAHEVGGGPLREVVTRSAGGLARRARSASASWYHAPPSNRPEWRRCTR
jgi:hypothetical protein